MTKYTLQKKIIIMITKIIRNIIIYNANIFYNRNNTNNILFHSKNIQIIKNKHQIINWIVTILLLH